MKKPAILCLLLAFSFRSFAAEEDFLIFDMTDAIRPPGGAYTPPPPPAPAATEAEPQVKLKAQTASVNLILLDVPDKSWATAKLATLKADGSQKGRAAQPIFDVEGATVELAACYPGITKALKAKHAAFPDGATFKVSTGGKYEVHERDAAGAGIAVLIHSLISGEPVADGVALLGGVGADGKITSVSRLGTRLRLVGEGISAVGVPLVNLPDVRDLALMNDLDILLATPVIGLKTVEDAISLGSSARPPNVAKAFELFAAIQTAAKRTPVATLVKNAEAQKRLAEIVTLMPDHLSAQLLLQTGRSKLAGRITFATSQQATLKAVKPFWDVIKKHRNTSTADTAARKEIQTIATEAGNVLLRIQPRCHPSVERYLIATKSLMRAWANVVDIPVDATRKRMLEEAWGKIRKIEDEIKLEKAKVDKLKPTD